MRFLFYPKKNSKDYVLTNQHDTKVDRKGIYPPEFDNLHSLHTKVRNKHSIAIPEFGSGYSTFALAKALDKESHIYSRFMDGNIHHPNSFCLMTVDVSE